MNEVKPRRLRVSHEDMERINRSIEVARRVGMTEREAHELRNDLIKIYGEEVSSVRETRTDCR